MYFIIAVVSFIILMYKGVISASGHFLWGGIPFIIFFTCTYILRKIILKIEIGTLRQEMELCLQEYEYQKQRAMTVGRQTGGFLKNFTDVADKIAGISNDFVVGTFAAGAKLLFEGSGGKESESERKAREKYEEMQRKVAKIEVPAKDFSLLICVIVGSSWYLSYNGYVASWFWYLDQYFIHS